MKREFLEELGLDKATIDEIMSEHGKSVSALKERCKDLTEKESIIAALTEERDGLIASLSAESEKLTAFKSGIIDSIVKEARPSSALAEKELRRVLSECECGNIKEELKRIMESDPDAFRHETVSVPYFSAFNPCDMPFPTPGYRSVR